MEPKEQIEHFLKGVKTSSFNVKYNDTEINWDVVKSFKLFCDVETQNNYLLGIKKLLEFYKADWKYQTLHEDIKTLRSELLSFSTQITGSTNEQTTSTGISTFGQEE